MKPWLLTFMSMIVTFGAQAELLQFPVQNETTRLTIYSSGDVESFSPLLLAFQIRNPTVAIDYHLLETVELYNRVRTEMDDQQPTADLVLSSAMDLQIKLVNDGYTQPYSSSTTDQLPRWANWRDEAFSFTFEPAVILYNRKHAPELSKITSRFELAQHLASSSQQKLNKKVITYDPARSGVGYMFDTHDAIQSEDFWYLVRSLGSANVEQVASSSTMIDRVSSGKALLAYNVLGSYAKARARENKDLAITLPQDYCLVMSRVAVIPLNAKRPGLAGSFIDYLLSRDGQKLIAGSASLYSLRSDIEGELTAARLRQEAQGPLIPINLGPGLLVYLDRMKRSNFLTRWQQATQR